MNAHSQDDPKPVGDTLGAVVEDLGGFITKVTTACVTCSAQFETTRVRVIGKTDEYVLSSIYCDACRPAEDPTFVLPAVRDFHREWERMCPRQYLDISYGPESDGFTNPYRIPEPIRAAFRRYRYSNLGIIATGRSGTFKSRTMHLLLKHLFFEGRRVKLYDSVALGTAIADSFESDGYSVLLDNLTVVDVLSIDDLDKMKFTERTSEGLYALLERRTSRRLPTFITLNVRGPELSALIAKVSPHLAEPIIRRLHDFFIQIETNKLIASHQASQQHTN